MNENVLSFIKWVAGIAITLLIISIAFLMFNTSRSSTMEIVGKLGEFNTQISEGDLIMYDDYQVTGSEVKNIIKKYENEYLGIQVITGKNRSGSWYGYNASISGSVANIGTQSSNKFSDTIDPTSNQYINPNGDFMGKVYRDENGTIVALVFEQK